MVAPEQKLALEQKLLKLQAMASTASEQRMKRQVAIMENVVVSIKDDKGILIIKETENAENQAVLQM